MAEDKPKIGLVVMIGMPGSGKTTLSRSAKTGLGNDADHAYDIHLIPYDELIPVSVQSHGGETSWKEARQAVAMKVSDMIEQLKMKSQSESKTRKPILLFIDDNMYYRSMRYEYFQMARLHEISFCQIYLSISFEEALRVNSERQIDTVPEDVIKRMSTRIQPPNPDHNVWELHSLTIPAHNVDLAAIDCLVQRSLGDPARRLVEAEPSVAQSVVHAADLELRGLVGRLMRAQTGDRETLRDRAAWLNEQRQRVLSQLRAGDLRLPTGDVSAFFEQQFDVQSATDGDHSCCSKEESSWI